MPDHRAEQRLLARAINQGWIEPSLLPDDRAKSVYDRLFIYASGKSATQKDTLVPDDVAIDALKTLDKADSRARDRLLKVAISDKPKQPVQVNTAVAVRVESSERRSLTADDLRDLEQLVIESGRNVSADGGMESLDTSQPTPQTKIIPSTNGHH